MISYENITYDNLKNRLEEDGIARLKLSRERAVACRKLLSSFFGIKGFSRKNESFLKRMKFLFAGLFRVLYTLVFYNKLFELIVFCNQLNINSFKEDRLEKDIFVFSFEKTI